MSWDAGRKTNAASFTVVPPSTPASPQDTTTAVPLSLSGLRDDFINWFFGFPGSLIAQRIRHYHWGRYVGQYNPDYSKTFLYQKPSTEEFYQSAQTQQPLDFVSLSGYQKNDSNSGENIFCGVDNNGTLWTWGLLETAFAVSNPFGTGENADFPVGVEIGLFSAYGAFTGQANKLRAVTPQPVYGENDDLSGVVFTKAVAGTECVVALTYSGSLYCSGNGGFVFGFGDYYTNGSTATGGRSGFSYPKLVKHWDLSFEMVGGQLVGTAVETSPKTWVDIALLRSQLRAVTNDGKIYGTYGLQLARTKSGGTYQLTVTNAGKGYSAAPTVSVTASPTGDTMTITATVITSNKSVSLNVTNWGSGYTTAPTITINEPTAAEKTATPDWRVATATVQVLPSTDKWAKVFTGDYGVFALDIDGKLFYIESTSGFPIANNFNQLATGTVFTKAAVGGAFLVALDSAGGVWTMGTANTGTGSARTTLQLLDAGPWIDIAAGINHGVMLKSSGEVWCWGNNTYGQLGDGTLTSSSVPVKVSGNAVWKSVFSASLSTLAVRDEQYDSQGNRINPIAFAG
jgi:hypothetical protein